MSGHPVRLGVSLRRPPDAETFTEAAMTNANLADATSDAVSQALQNVLAENGGGFVAGFCFVAEVIDSDGDRGWVTAHAENQSPSLTLGMLRWHTLTAEHDVGLYLEADDEDDL